MNEDFDSCSSSGCDAYGALYCRICVLHYCHDHACLHLNPYLESKALNKIESPEEVEDAELDNLHSNSTNISACTTRSLRLRRDSLFKELKEIQKELDSRAIEELGPLKDLSYNFNKVSKRSTTNKSKNKSLPKKVLTALKLLEAKGLLSQVFQTLQSQQKEPK